MTSSDMAWQAIMLFWVTNTFPVGQVLVAAVLGSSIYLVTQQLQRACMNRSLYLRSRDSWNILVNETNECKMHFWRTPERQGDASNE